MIVHQQQDSCGFLVFENCRRVSIISSKKMTTRPWLVESDKPTYQVLKWIGGGGFGQVFKVLRDGEARMES